MNPREAYYGRVNSFRRSILTLQLIVMVMGGVVFTLAVINRPVLRITKPEHVPTVKWIVNVMVAASLVQILAAAYDIFSGCWKLIWPIYLGIAGTGLTILLELTAICANLYLYFSSSSMVNEEVIHPWYWVECLKFSAKCHERMLGYIHWYILPQVILAIITVFIQIITILLLGRLVRTIADRHKMLQETQEKYRDEYEEKKYAKAWGGDEEEDTSPGNTNLKISPAGSWGDVMKTPKKVQFSDDQDGAAGGSVSLTSSARKRAAAPRNTEEGTENIEMVQVHTTTYQTQIHVEVSTPASICMEDHGYIAGSRVSMDFDKA